MFRPKVLDDTAFNKILIYNCLKKYYSSKKE